MTFDEFCDTYYDRVVGLAVHAFGGADAEDVAHEALSRALAAYDSLDPRRDAWPWLATVVRNAGRDALRRRPLLPLDAARSVAAPDAAFDAAVSAEERALLARALRGVPEDDREVLLMRVRDELSYAEMAARTGRSPGALRVQAVRARQRLAAEFARLGGTAYGAGAAVSLRLARLRERAAGLVAAVPQAAQVVTAAVVCGGIVGAVACGLGAAPGAAGGTGGAPGTVAAGAGRDPGGAVARPVAAAAGDEHGMASGATRAATTAARGGAVAAGVTVRGPGGSAPAPRLVAPVDAPHTAGPHRGAVSVDVTDRAVGLWSDGQGARPPAGCALPLC
ncbi:MAG TPA: sigma-70 family RNA polymerase sigma factor [Mycobacteriales bacterium]|jgi:RNA polymerase sigma-70 factor (ECF subfamily)